MKFKKVVSSILVISVLLPTLGSSHDFGVKGELYPIIERDIRVMMVEQAMGQDWDAANDELTGSGKSYSKRLVKRYMESPEKDTQVWIDPSIELTSDIQAPVKQSDGTYEWQILYPKGTKVNPLNTAPPLTTFVFFDGENSKQLDLVKKLIAEDYLKFVPIEAGAGNLEKDIKELGRPVYYANDAMISKFSITTLPSLLYAGKDDKKEFLGLSSFASPFEVNHVLSTWRKLSYTN